MLPKPVLVEKIFYIHCRSKLLALKSLSLSKNPRLLRLPNPLTLAPSRARLPLPLTKSLASSHPARHTARVRFILSTLKHARFPHPLTPTSSYLAIHLQRPHAAPTRFSDGLLKPLRARDDPVARCRYLNSVTVNPAVYPRHSAHFLSIPFTAGNWRE